MIPFKIFSCPKKIVENLTNEEKDLFSSINNWYSYGDKSNIDIYNKSIENTLYINILVKCRLIFPLSEGMTFFQNMVFSIKDNQISIIKNVNYIEEQFNMRKFLQVVNYYFVLSSGKLIEWSNDLSILEKRRYESICMTIIQMEFTEKLKKQLGIKNVSKREIKLKI